MSDKTSILLVDDDISFRKTLSQILCKKGYEVIEAGSGTRALELVTDRVFGVVLMDIKMQAMDGVEAYKKMKQIRPYISVIMMTAFALDELVASAIKEGAHAVLRKPLDIEEMVKIIEEAKDGAYLAVVDDDPAFCATMKQMLEKKGYAVKACSNGRECIALAKKSDVDIFFIDMKMPVLNGLDTYLELRQIRPKAVVVMMTAYRQDAEEMVRQALEDGGYGCLYKPFDINEAINIISEVLSKKSQK